MSRKKTLEEKIGDLEQGRNSWLGPMREWLNEAQNIGKIAQNSDLSAKKVSAKKIFGSDLHLSAKKITGRPVDQWAAIAAGRNLEGKKELCYIMERVKGVGPSSQPWEGYIIAVIRHPQRTKFALQFLRC